MYWFKASIKYLDRDWTLEWSKENDKVRIKAYRSIRDAIKMALETDYKDGLLRGGMFYTAAQLPKEPFGLMGLLERIFGKVEFTLGPLPPIPARPEGAV